MTKTFDELRHVGRPNIADPERVMELIRGVLDRRWLTNDGPLVRQFESQISTICSAPEAIAMCNATVALEIAVRALGMSGEVIVPSFTFVATAHCLSWQGITPVFCDIDPESCLLDVQHAESLVNEKTTGIIGVNLWGRMDNVEALERLAAKHRLKLLFDSAHSLGCSFNSRSSGQFGDAEVFSFHATKFINSFEGGAVVTRDAELAKTIRSMRNFGFQGEDHVVEIGTNGKMTEVCAAMGIVSLDAMPEIVAVNRRNFEIYRKRLSELPGIKLFAPLERDAWNHQYLVLFVDANHARKSRDELRQLMLDHNVYARKYFNPGIHRMPAYRNNQVTLRVTEAICEQVLVLPTGTAMTETDVHQVCDILVAAIRP